jgi:hypothetical protein
VREQTVLEVQVVREPMHQNDRRFRPQVVPDVDPVLVPLHKSLFVGHYFLGIECRLTVLNQPVHLRDCVVSEKIEAWRVDYNTLLDIKTFVILQNNVRTGCKRA